MKELKREKLSSSKKRPYEKPAVVHRERMESVAGACEITDPINGKTGILDNCTLINS